MKSEIISLANYPAYGESIPVEFVENLSSPDVHFIGAQFAMSTVGAAIWHNDEGSEYGTLLSLYVLPEARLLGVGTFLLESVVEEMKKAHKKGISFKYEVSGDKALLSDFFASVGYDTQSLEVPLGSISLKEAVKAIAEKAEGVKMSGSKASELGVKEKAIAVKWLNKVSGGRAAEYIGKQPENFFTVRDDKVKSALILSANSENVLSLDYAFSENPLDLLGMLKSALNEIAGKYSPDTEIEMLLSTQAGQNLYEKLFGEAASKCELVTCTQLFD